MDREQADAAFEALTLEQREARVAAQRRKEVDARAVAGQKRMALSVLVGFVAGAGLGYVLYRQWHLPGLFGAAFGLVVGSILRSRKA